MRTVPAGSAWHGVGTLGHQVVDLLYALHKLYVSYKVKTA